ncbi:MAG TPA: hypothetical protein ENN19_03970 [Chloroflexi bacterium]|nr:hypothetical protein [Chloroflexota bacterium]
MRLKHLSLQGYKSFATKTEFEFPTGITAVVGPNGSGKSNIADGIRWVLGEQSIRALRGKSTVDMIFAGGRRRAQAGMAEVSLTLDNADGWLPIEFTEVTITRRAYRSGENEYILNGSRVRLRDITALLGESGLGRHAYTVIGQGLVDAALALRAQERRTLFEDAAGISHYRSQREDAVARMEETQHNLARVYDIVSEVKPRLERLQRDSVQVEEHRRVSAHLERLQRTWYGYHWGEGQASLGRALRVVDALEQSLVERRQEATRLDEQLAELREQEGELRAKLRDWHRESADLHDEVNAAQRELAVAEERARLSKVRREELEAEFEPLGERRQAQAETVEQARNEVERLAQDLAARKQELAEMEREWAVVEAESQAPARRRTEVEQKLRACRSRAERLNQELLEARQAVSQLESERAVAEERARQVQARREETLAEIVPLEAQRAEQAARVQQARDQMQETVQVLETRQERAAELERAWAAKRREAQAPDPQRAEIEQTLATHRAAVERLEQEILDLRGEEARLQGEQRALDRLIEEGSMYDVGVRAVLQAKLAGVLAPLASLIQVPAEWEGPLEATLARDLQAVVVERAALVADVRRLLEQTGGRLTLLPLDTVRAAAHTAPSLPAGAVGAAERVTCDPHVRPAVDAVLGSVALCDDLAAAQALLPAMGPGGLCVTRAGEALRADGAVSIGRVEVGGEGLLADERARREIPRQLDAVALQVVEAKQARQAAEEAIAAAQARLAELDREAARRREAMAQAEREAVGQAETAVAVARESLSNRQSALQREMSLLEQLDGQIGALRRQADELSKEHGAILARLQALRDDVDAAGEKESESESGHEELAAEGPLSTESSSPLVQARARCREIEAQQQAEARRIAGLEERLEALAQQAEAAREEALRVERETVGQTRTQVAVAGETLRSQQATLRQEETQLARIETQIEARRQRIEELADEQRRLAARTEALRAASTRKEAQLRQVHERIRPAEEALNRLNERHAALEEEERRMRDRVRDIEAHLNRAQLDAERCRDELKMLERQIEEDLGLVELELAEDVTAQTPLPLKPLVSALPVVEELPAGLEDEIQRLKARLRRLGSVNPNAPEDCAEVQERYRFLTEQSADLEAASEKLHQAVAELDELMIEAFWETFEAVAGEFSQLFTTLFDGGEAQLELTEPDDLLNTGVDIVARPPGKRPQRLALLSGGERSLTAVALLFAILRVCPAPFCVLDEVDAMLDEANVGRFRKVLQGLAENTQFVVITHTRGTVEVADTIYGVSMGSDAVSQTVSLQLDEV